MKKIYAFIIISMMLFSALLSSIYIDTASAITQHEVGDGTTYGEITSDNIGVVEGNVIISTFRPNGAITHNAFNNDGPAGEDRENNYLYVDESGSHDGNTTYVYGGSWGGGYPSSENGVPDTYALEDATGYTGDIINVTCVAFAKQYSYGSGEVRFKPHIYIDGTEYSSSDWSLINATSDTYQMFTESWATNPATSTSWTWSDINSLGAGWRRCEWDSGTRVTQVYIEVTEYQSDFIVTRTVGLLTEINNFTFSPSHNFSGDVTLDIPCSSDVKGIISVTNNTGDVTAIEVKTSDELVNNTFWYDVSNQLVHIRTINITIATTLNWTINCSYGAVFSLIIPSYLEVGQYFHSQGFISDSDGFAVSGVISETRVLNESGVDALAVNPKWNCTDGNYRCTFSTTSLLPGTYSISIEFTDPGSGIMFKEGATLYLSTTPGTGIYVVSTLHFAFYNNNTGLGLNSELFKIYASEDTTISASDRIYIDEYVTYTGQTLYYRVDDYFDNQVYPTVGSYETLSITDINQFEDVPIDWHSFSVKNMNHSIVHFKMTNGSRTYSQYLYPYEPFYWNVLAGTYTINLTYYDAETDAIVDYAQENITITDDTYYWIRGYDLQDIVIEITNTNTTIMDQIINVGVNINNDGATIIRQTLNMASYLSNTESNITNQINLVWSEVNNSQTNIVNQVNSVWSTVNNTDTTVVNQANSVRQSITNTETNITGQLNSVWQTVNNTETEVGDQANLIIQGVNNFENNITTQVNGIWQDVNNSNTTIHTQLNTIVSDVSNVDSNINTQVNYIRQDITNWATYTDQYNTLPGTVSHWTMDEGTGTLANDSIGDNDGTMSANVTWTDGKYGNALNFDDGTVNCGNDPSLDISNNITISAWINVPEHGNLYHIFNKYVGSSSGYYFSTGNPGHEDKLRFVFVDEDDLYTATESTISYPVDQWSHVVVTYNGTVVFYVDGEADVRNTYNTLIKPTTAINTLIGRFTDAYYFNGSIDDVRVFNRALSSDEVTQLYQSSTGTSGTSYIGTQINAVDQSIENANTTIHTQINSVIQTVNNLESNITTQITTVSQEINNFETNITTQINGVTTSIINSETNITTQLTVVEAMVTNTESNITTQINYVSTAITNTETNITNQVNNIHATISNTETNITNQINNIEIDITNMNTTVHNQLNIIITDISNTNTTIVNQANMIVTTISNTETNITTQLNAIETIISNTESNITAQVNIVLTNISNINSSIHGQLNVLSTEITNVETGLTTQINNVDVEISNFESNMTTQINNVISAITNTETDITNQMNLVWNSVNNSNTSIINQINGVSTQIINSETNITTQINTISTSITNTETNLTNQINVISNQIINQDTNLTTQFNIIDINITNMNTSITNQINSVSTQITNHDTDIDTQLNTILTTITNTDTNIIDQVNLIWNEINNTNSTIGIQINGVNTKISTFWSNVNTSFTVIQNKVDYTETNITNLITDMNATLLAQLTGVLENVSDAGISVFDRVTTVLNNISNINTSLHDEILAKTLNIIENVTNEHYDTILNIVENISAINTSFFSELQTQALTIMQNVTEQADQNLNTITNISNAVGNLVSGNLSAMIQEVYDNISIVLSDVNNLTINITGNLTVDLTEIFENLTSIMENLSLTNVSIGNLINVSIGNLSDVVFEMWGTQNTSFEILENRSMTVFNFYNTNQGLGLDRETLRIYVNGSRLIDNLYYCTNGSLINLTIKDYYNFTLYTNNFTISAPFTFIDLGLTFHSWLFGDKNDEYYMISLLKDGGSRWWERGIVPYGEREFMIPSGNYTLRIYDKDWVELYNDTHIINNSRVYIIEGTNLTEIISGQSVIQGQLLELSSELDYALMPDIEIISFNPPMIFSIYDKEGMALGSNIYQICPALITTATTRIETTGNWINSTAMIPGNDTVENGTVTILEDTLYISGSNSISYVSITYTDNGTLMQNTTYIPHKINLYGQNITINASNDIHILRETTYNQVKKFYWTYDASTGEHTSGIDIINSMDIPIYDVYIYIEFSNKSTADPNTVVMRDISNSGLVLKRGESYDISLSGIHFYLLSIEADSTRGFAIEYTKRFDDAYRYGEETINIPGFIETVWNGLSYNTFDISWINDGETIFRGALYAKIDFEVTTGIDSNSIRIWDNNNNQELDESDFIAGDSFIRIGADGLGDINPGSGRSFSVYFLLSTYPGADPTEFHWNTALFTIGVFPVTVVSICFLIGLIIMAYSIYSYIFNKNKDWWKGIAIAMFILFMSTVLAFMGV